jgi:hypothetical protein
MSNYSCKYTVRADLYPLEEESHDNLTTIIQRCPIVCEIVTGEGNPDLGGTGVRLYMLSIGNKL